MLSFSTDKNVLIILLDGFSGGYIDIILKEAPSTFSEFSGFKWYPNTLTTSTATWSSIAAMLGGKNYSVEAINKRTTKSIQEEITEAYNVLPSAFTQHGYQVSYFNTVYASTSPF